MTAVVYGEMIVSARETDVLTNTAVHLSQHCHSGRLRHHTQAEYDAGSLSHAPDTCQEVRDA